MFLSVLGTAGSISAGSRGTEKGSLGLVSSLSPHPEAGTVLLKERQGGCVGVTYSLRKRVHVRVNGLSCQEAHSQLGVGSDGDPLQRCLPTTPLLL